MRAVAVIVLGAALACGSAPATPNASGREATSLGDLRFAVASDPGNDANRRRLAIRLEQSGLPGAALDHWSILERRRELGDHRERLGALLVRRGRARLERGDPGALADLDHAARLGAEVDPREAIALEVAFLERVAGAPDTHGARRRLPPLLRDALERGPRRAGLEAAGAVGSWLWHAGSRRAGQRWLEAYIERGGRDAERLRDHATALSWWRGAGARLELDREEALVTAGALVCGLGRVGAAPRCPEVVRAPGQPRLAAELWRRSEGAPPDPDPLRAAGWTAAALYHSQEPGQHRGWLRALAQRVDLEAVASHRDLPIFAAPTLLRAAGRERRSRDALELAVAELDAMPPEQREVVAAELAARGDPRAASLGFAARTPSQVLVNASAQRLSERVGEATGKGEIQTGDLRIARALVVVDEHPELAAVARASLVDSARAERLARAYADAAVLPTSRLLAVAELFRALGDPGRHRRWTQRAVELAPRDAEALHRRGRASLALGDSSDAEIYFTRAAAMSGNAAESYARAADVALSAGKPLLALAMSRRALQMQAPGRGRAAAELAIRAAAELGRPQQVRALRRQFATATEVFDSTDVDVALDSGRRRDLELAAQWHPLAARPRAALLAMATQPAQARPVIEELAVIAFAAPAIEARPAAEALVEHFAGRNPELERVFARVLRGL